MRLWDMKNHWVLAFLVGGLFFSRFLLADPLSSSDIQKGLGLGKSSFQIEEVLSGGGDPVLLITKNRSAKSGYEFMTVYALHIGKQGGYQVIKGNLFSFPGHDPKILEELDFFIAKPSVTLKELKKKYLAEGDDPVVAQEKALKRVHYSFDVTHVDSIFDTDISKARFTATIDPSRKLDEPGVLVDAINTSKKARGLGVATQMVTDLMQFVRPKKPPVRTIATHCISDEARAIFSRLHYSTDVKKSHYYKDITHIMELSPDLLDMNRESKTEIEVTDKLGKKLEEVNALKIEVTDTQAEDCNK